MPKRIYDQNASHGMHSVFNTEGTGTASSHVKKAARPGVMRMSTSPGPQRSASPFCLDEPQTGSDTPSKPLRNLSPLSSYRKSSSNSTLPGGQFEAWSCRDWESPNAARCNSPIPSSLKHSPGSPPCCTPGPPSGSCTPGSPGQNNRQVDLFQLGPRSPVQGNRDLRSPVQQNRDLRSPQFSPVLESRKLQASLQSRYREVASTEATAGQNGKVGGSPDVRPGTQSPSPQQQQQHMTGSASTPILNAQPVQPGGPLPKNTRPTELKMIDEMMKRKQQDLHGLNAKVALDMNSRVERRQSYNWGDGATIRDKGNRSSNLIHYVGSGRNYDRDPEKPRGPARGQLCERMWKGSGYHGYADNLQDLQEDEVTPARQQKLPVQLPSPTTAPYAWKERAASPTTFGNNVHLSPCGWLKDRENSHECPAPEELQTANRVPGTIWIGNVRIPSESVLSRPSPVPTQKAVTSPPKVMTSSRMPNADQVCTQSVSALPMMTTGLALPLRPASGVAPLDMPVGDLRTVSPKNQRTAALGLKTLVAKYSQEDNNKARLAQAGIKETVGPKMPGIPMEFANDEVNAMEGLSKARLKIEYKPKNSQVARVH